MTALSEGRALLPVVAATVDDTRVSFSSLARHRKCPQAWVYDSVRRLTVLDDRPRVRAEFGSWWHAVRAADAVRRGRALGSLIIEPEKITTGDLGPSIDVAAIADLSSETVHLLADDWWMRQTETLKAYWVETTGTPLPEHLREMDARWCDAWAEETATERPLAVELQVRQNLPLGDDRTFRLDGQVDEVYHDTKRGLVVVRDHKSNSTIPAAESLDDLLDSQTHLYAWLASKTLPSDLLPQGAAWALSYDRARTKSPSAPALTKSGSLSKSTTDYDLAAYLAFTAEPVPYPGLKKDGSGAGTYERDPAVVERLSSPSERAKWNDRTLTPVNLNIVRSHLREARNTRQAMESTLETFHLQGQATRNLNRMGCGWCDFQALCLAEMRAGGPLEDLDPGDYGLRQDAPSAL